MSNRKRIKRPPPQNPASAMLAALDGARIPGGCQHCNAYQVITAHAQGLPNVHTLGVYHDDNCPWLARLAAR